jgi:hypothetical protein
VWVDANAANACMMATSEVTRHLFLFLPSRKPSDNRDEQMHVRSNATHVLGSHSQVKVAVALLLTTCLLSLTMPQHIQYVSMYEP